MVMRTKNILEVATIERAKSGKIYPAGTTLVQISAAKGDLLLLEEAGTVEGKYAVVISKGDILPDYLHYSIQHFYPEFFHKWRTGLNLQVSNLERLEISYDDDKTVQQEFVDKMKVVFNLRDAYERELAVYEQTKKDMFSIFFGPVSSAIPKEEIVNQ